jgi:hypothetical protein
MKYAFIIIVGFALSGCVTATTIAGAMTITGGAVASAVTQFEEFKKEELKKKTQAE